MRMLYSCLHTHPYIPQRGYSTHTTARREQRQSSVVTVVVGVVNTHVLSISQGDLEEDVERTLLPTPVRYGTVSYDEE